MAEVVVFHHVHGLTSGVRDFGERVRQAGHTVHVPDLYEGRVFERFEDGMAHAAEVGFGTIAERGRLAARQLAELRHQPGQLGTGAVKDALQLLRVEHAGERAQRLDHGRVGEDPVSEVEAAAGQRDRTGRAGPAPLAGLADQLGDQAGLADAGLARHHDDRGLAARRPLERPPELDNLSVAADQHRAGDTPDHANDHRGSGPS
jgi:hypothetical protein